MIVDFPFELGKQVMKSMIMSSNTKSGIAMSSNISKKHDYLLLKGNITSHEKTFLVMRKYYQF